MSKRQRKLLHDGADTATEAALKAGVREALDVATLQFHIARDEYAIRTEELAHIGKRIDLLLQLLALDGVVAPDPRKQDGTTHSGTAG